MVYLQAVLGPEPVCLGSLPGEVPWNSCIENILVSKPLSHLIFAPFPLCRGEGTSEGNTHSADLLDRSGAGVGRDGRGVAEVGVDADERLAVVRLDVLHHHRALPLRLAVAARPVQLAEVHHREAVDGHGPDAVVLDHLVVGACGTTIFHRC